MKKTKLINKDTQKTIEINSNVTEQDLIESCLNYYHSGYDYKLFLFFYALAHSWHVDKLTYYINLIEDKEINNLLRDTRGRGGINFLKKSPIPPQYLK